MSQTTIATISPPHQIPAQNPRSTIAPARSNTRLLTKPTSKELCSQRLHRCASDLPSLIAAAFDSITNARNPIHLDLLDPARRLHRRSSTTPHHSHDKLSPLSTCTHRPR